MDRVERSAATLRPHGVLASGRWRDYYQLTKPKVVALLLLTAVVGMCLAVPGWLPGLRVLWATLGIGLMAAGAAAYNHLLDQQIDRQMARTQRRPLPQGRLQPRQVLIFATLLSLLGLVVLLLGVNTLTAWLTLASLVGYALVYTAFLKRATPQNIVIGGLAGAAPPLLGWTAMTGSLAGEALLLVMIIFTWTPPHFWSLAIHRREDYARAGVPMLPVTHGIQFTKTCILLYCILLLVVCTLPYLVGMSGELYLLVATGLNLRFLQLAWQLKRQDDLALAMKTFRFSIVHLMALFVVLLVDHWIW